MPPGWDGVETIAQTLAGDLRLSNRHLHGLLRLFWTRLSAAWQPGPIWPVLKKPFDNVEVLQLAEALTRKWLLTQELQHRQAKLGRG